MLSSRRTASAFSSSLSGSRSIIAREAIRSDATGSDPEGLPPVLPPATALSVHSGAFPVSLSEFDDWRDFGSLLAVKPCSDNRKASLSVADNEAVSERVRGIEPPPEAWENDYQ